MKDNPYSRKKIVGAAHKLAQAMFHRWKAEHLDADETKKWHWLKEAERLEQEAYHDIAKQADKTPNPKTYLERFEELIKNEAKRQLQKLIRRRLE